MPDFDIRSEFEKLPERAAMAAKELLRPQEKPFLVDLAKISLPLATWARQRLSEGFDLVAVRNAMLVQQARQRRGQAVVENADG